MNETEIRSKVVDRWLRNHGFADDQIILEKTFKIRLGKALHVVEGEVTEKQVRSDYLVRSNDGRNLFIVETKAESEPIDHQSRKQGICYARLLDEGGIAPFVIVTNGRETQIIDTLTEQVLSEEDIPLNHPYVAANFRVTLDDLSYRTEALEHLISISPQNLMAFCRGQVTNRIQRLRGESRTSGKKYIPHLYIERDHPKRRISELIEEGRSSILVMGPPQVGKTNFICRFVEDQLAAGVPCLFYPAVSLGSGLLEAIREDFEWTFGDSSSAFQIIRQKLVRILQGQGKPNRILLFVEGLNENEELIRVFSSEAERLQFPQITLIVSFTTYSASRILRDPAGNLSHISVAAGLEKRDIPLFEFGSANDLMGKSVVHIGRFSTSETDLAYSVYARAFDVSVPTDHKRTTEPLLLRCAMEQFEGKRLPVAIDALQILEKTINEKLSRLTALSENVGRAVLTEIASRLCDGQSVTEFWLHHNASCLESFFEAGLLARKGDGTYKGVLDFYVTSERSFVIAAWVRNWPSVLQGKIENLAIELAWVAAFATRAEALGWFLRQDVNREVLMSLGEELGKFDDRNVRQVIVMCLCDYIAIAGDFSDVFDDDADDRLHDLATNIGAELANDRSEVGEILRNVIVDPKEDAEIRRNCAIGLASFNPETCLEALSLISGGEITPHIKVVAQLLEPGFRKAVDGINTQYYGEMMCKGYMYTLEDDQTGRLDEYERVIGVWAKTIQIFRFSPSSDELEGVLQDLNPNHQTIGDPYRQHRLF